MVSISETNIERKEDYLELVELIFLEFMREMSHARGVP
jgi:hypothetical protein